MANGSEVRSISEMYHSFIPEAPPWCPGDCRWWQWTGPHAPAQGGILRAARVRAATAGQAAGRIAQHQGPNPVWKGVSKAQAKDTAERLPHVDHTIYAWLSKMALRSALKMSRRGS